MSAPEIWAKALKGLKTNPMSARNGETLKGCSRNSAIWKIQTRYANW
jgi:uncharacterized C2H2 Zn-finger protein